MAKWGNEPNDDTSLNDLKINKEIDEVEETEEQIAAREKLEAEEAEAERVRLEEEEAEAKKKEDEDAEAKKKEDEDAEDKKKDEDGDFVDLDAELAEAEEAEKKRLEEEAEKKAKADEGKTEEELAKEKEEAEKAEALQKEADEKAAKEKEEADKVKDVPETFELKIEDQTYDAESATQSIKKLNAIEDDEFLKNLIEHRNNGGDVLDYLRATDSSEDEMSSLELARYAFDHDPANEGISREDLNLLWETELEEKYQTSSEDEKQVKLGEVKLKREAARAKAAIKANKAKFSIAKPKTEVASELIQAELEKAKLEQTTAQADSLQQWNEEVDNHEVTKTLREKGMVVIEVDGKKIGFKPTNPDKLVSVNKDINEFIKLSTDDEGHMKLDEFNEIMAFATDKAKFKSDLVKFGMMQERKNSLAKSKKIAPADKKETSQDHGNKQGKSATVSEMKKAGWGAL
jgi:hypothetical protein